MIRLCDFYQILLIALTTPSLSIHIYVLQSTKKYLFVKNLIKSW